MCTSALSSCMCRMHVCCMSHDDDAGDRAWAASRDGLKEGVEVLVPGPEGCPTVSSAVTPAGGAESGACDACMQQRPTRHATPPVCPTPIPSSHLTRCDWRGRGGETACRASQTTVPRRSTATKLRTTCQRDQTHPSEKVDHRQQRRSSTRIIDDLCRPETAAANERRVVWPVGCVDQRNTDGLDPASLRNVMAAALPVRRTTSIFPLPPPSPTPVVFPSSRSAVAMPAQL